jgi:LysR family glycine cleavage system transcriptional activator
MSSPLPLNALRAFAEAARHESFKAAAAELHVTAGAVSRQVKQLEARLGRALFERHAHGVRLNTTGRRLYTDITAGFERIASGYQTARSVSPVAGLSVSAPPSFSQYWLLPRLADFETDHGDIEIALDASQAFCQPAWTGDRARLAIRYGRGPWPGVRAVGLLRDRLFPVCAPALLERGPPLHEPADLAKHRLLHVSWCSRQDVAFPGWREWLIAAGAAGIEAPVQRHYSLFGLALDQAIAGHGIALVSEAIVAERLAAGVLVRAFGQRYVLESPFTYDLILPAQGEAPPLARRFIDWLVGQARCFEHA